MKKIISLSIATAVLAACGGSKKTEKSNTPGYIIYPTPKAKVHKGALNKIIKDGNLLVAKHVTDGSSVKDKSFNQTIWKGVSAYTGDSEKYYVIPGSARSQELGTIYAATMKRTQLLVAGGYQHQAPLTQFIPKLKANQGVIFLDGEVEGKNIMSVLFKVEETAFYAGYFASEYLSEHYYEFDVKGSEGLKVGTYGGMNFGAVTGFMAGFQQGVDYWNTNKGKNDRKVEFIKLGTKVDSYFSGNFIQGGGKAISEILLNKGADIILPVAGPQTLDTLAAITEKGKNTLVIGVDTDQVKLYESHTSKFLTSILKKLDKATEKGIKHIYGEADYEGYGLGKTVIGTMENELTDLATDGNNKLTTSKWEQMKENEKLVKTAKAVENKFRI